MRRFIPLYLSALALAAVALTGCATTPGTQASRVADLRMAYDAGHAAALAYEQRPGAKAAIVAALIQGDAAALAALTAYSNAPSDSARAQATAASVAALTAYVATVP